ncbi:alpha-tubulin n-acetyltransferase [Pelomyxa schiedti]|nr:alpha-tubulin n-acetyltransferase [Pelomyxa schiedti]
MRRQAIAQRCVNQPHSVGSGTEAMAELVRLMGLQGSAPARLGATSPGDDSCATATTVAIVGVSGKGPSSDVLRCAATTSASATASGSPPYWNCCSHHHQGMPSVGSGFTTSLHSMHNTSGASSMLDTYSEDGTTMGDIIDSIGVDSARAQGLPRPVTSTSILIENCSQTLYLAMELRGVDRSERMSAVVIGLLKVGPKHLFLNTSESCMALVEVTPICVLDFYVVERMQRCGIGKLLFEHMLQKEDLKACDLGYDKPSLKFLSFLRKHYGLTQYVKQPNNFVVFNSYFQSHDTAPRHRRIQNVSPNTSPSPYRSQAHTQNGVSYNSPAHLPPLSPYTSNCQTYSPPYETEHGNCTPSHLLPHSYHPGFQDTVQELLTLTPPTSPVTSHTSTLYRNRFSTPQRLPTPPQQVAFTKLHKANTTTTYSSPSDF